MSRSSRPARRGRALAALCGLAGTLLLGACSSAPKRPDPTPLGPVPPILQVAQPWHIALDGTVPGHFAPAVVGDSVVAAASNGNVMRIETRDGKVLWRAHVQGGISAACGSDGTFTAVVNARNQVVSLGPKGQVLWRYQLASSVLTPPAVVRGTVVVQSADQHVWAFNAASGQKLWDDEFDAPSLLLQQGSGITAVGDQVLLGDARGRVLALGLETGAVRWEATMARPRGATEVERVVSITGAPAVAAQAACVRAYQSSVGCVALDTGRVLWTAAAEGSTALSADGQTVVGSQENGVVQAYAQADGKPLWHNDQLKWRDLNAPLLVGATIAVGDLQGYVSFLSAKDGQIIGRAATDGSPIRAPLAVAGNTLVALTRAGGVYGFVPR